MSIRDKFVKDFGEDTALAIEKAANFHENGLYPNKGSDPFKWTLMLAISYECISKQGYKDYHEIKPEAEDLREWIRENADMGSYDGDIDMLAVVAGAYQPYIKKFDEVKK